MKENEILSDVLQQAIDALKEKSWRDKSTEVLVQESISCLKALFYLTSGKADKKDDE